MTRSTEHRPWYPTPPPMARTALARLQASLPFFQPVKKAPDGDWQMSLLNPPYDYEQKMRNQQTKR